MKLHKTIKQQGFTLIEIMIAVAILGVLTAIALPSYTEYVKKGKRTEATVELLRLAQLQESYFVQNLSYANSLTQLGYATATITSEEGLYNVTTGSITPDPCTGTAVTPCTAYTITAIPPTGTAQANDTTCRGFRIDNVGRKEAYGGTLTTFGTTAAHIASARTCW